MSTDNSLFSSGSHPEQSSSASWPVIGTAATVGLTVFLCGVALQRRMLNGKERPPKLLLFGNSVSGVLAGVLTLKLIRDSIQSRDGIRARLETLAEMNHHIRNALQVIELSAHSTRNEQASSSISQAVNRIERVLREIAGAERRKTPRDESPSDTSGPGRMAS
jgi:hypothetical protein